ncbi:hypothetical protein M878_00390 [Streptomyces roseochromogenus subsp. oscitans DS 12.976]|uniref:Uncharacterized protein n=1 Tax=Streptomyces roseochromogenus subsp. oscitans DS 12.976 TaxID=1352936 RepID=V6KXK3_STRRC|nr:hypothetical protein M878_00390 [Streptomyces roseochromogenus subsp. oscitans DS 12.976]
MSYARCLNEVVTRFWPRALAGDELLFVVWV